jgi:hypothetical protein
LTYYLQFPDLNLRAQLSLVAQATNTNTHTGKLLLKLDEVCNFCCIQLLQLHLCLGDSNNHPRPGTSIPLSIEEDRTGLQYKGKLRDLDSGTHTDPPKDARGSL